MFRLRELERKDIPEVNRWRNDPELIANLGAPFRYIGSDTDFQWFDDYLKNRDKAVRCAVTGDDHDRILGLVSLISVDRINQSAVFNIMIGEEGDRGKGAGTFAVTEMLKHAFFDMNLNRVELAVLEDNARARHVYEKCGFIKEGVKRSVRFKQGRFVNMVIYSVLRDEYMRNRTGHKKTLEG